MPPKLCVICQERKAGCKRPKTGQPMCKECFFQAFEDEVHNTIITNKLFKAGDRVAIGASGGKDSTVLAYIMKILNERHNYGIIPFLLSIDEGITGYRDDSLETVKRNENEYEIPLRIISYKELYGWTMDEIVREVGLKNNCTFCGVFRRQALDRGAMLLSCNVIATGHNADDIAETVIMNVLRGDAARLARCTAAVTGADGPLPRIKPFKYTYEKDIVMYAYFKKLDYFSTECIYSPNAYRGYAREFLKDLEKIRPASIVDIIHAGEQLSFNDSESVADGASITLSNRRAVVNMPTMRSCDQCGYIASNRLCKACVLLENLNKGTAKLAVGRKAWQQTRVIGHGD
eukprot:TRINITY_DN2916_c0_g1::TRINITY_DN2916_c0_g1_i8::g.4279::m.4279 TRINITY_DN2916_c0_g1::TRINITY_DN2916_c0_g1_i8::g.4279  ORF type:complete len:346 (+),score=62.53,sp/Q05AW7/CTU1_XENLA/67.07/1e-165,ATP_bind_3/PF01171.15/5.7e-17,DUF2392/PF10288.4/0.021,tRNA_Me_trans/PF03054.11/0.031,NAD_synthase/PF02540.12/0.11,zf-C3HC4_2/PF13923.1/0.5,zf-C3HC4_2/PF13923.1/6.5e+02 TRINITY_DN2916_c0_g1_i8:74-1111(+)